MEDFCCSGIQTFTHDHHYHLIRRQKSRSIKKTVFNIYVTVCWCETSYVCIIMHVYTVYAKPNMYMTLSMYFNTQQMVYVCIYKPNEYMWAKHCFLMRYLDHKWDFTQLKIGFDLLKRSSKNFCTKRKIGPTCTLVLEICRLRYF